jgi:hypothetical protein
LILSELKWISLKGKNHQLNKEKSLISTGFEFEIDCHMITLIIFVKLKFFIASKFFLLGIILLLIGYWSSPNQLTPITKKKKTILPSLHANEDLLI